MKEKLKLYWNYFTKISPFIAVVFVVLWLKGCGDLQDASNRYENNLEALSSKTESFKLKNGQLASRNKLLTVTEKELRKQVWVKDDSLKVLIDQAKNPKAAIKWKTRVVFDTIFMPFSDLVPFEFNRTFKKENQWYSISGKVDQIGVTLNPPSLFNTQRLIVDYIKGKPVATVTNSNPHIVTESIEGQIIDVPKKRWVFGVGGSWNLIQDPYPGFFAGYKLFEF